MRRLGTTLVLALSGLLVSAAQAQPMAGATCKVESRERTTALGTLTCVDTPQRGLRWRLTRPTPATTITTTTTVPISTTPQAPTLTLGTAAVCGQLVLSWSGARPDTGWYSVQWTTPNDPNFNRYVMRNVRATTLSMRGFENGGRYLFRVFAMHNDWDGVWHSTENVTPHSNVLEVAPSGCTSSATTTTVPVVSCADGGTCAVGDTGPGGGIVFYVHPGGGTFACGPTLAATCRYLEVASTGGTNAWSDAQHQWSPVINTEIGADAQSTAIGTGYKNTLAMLAQNSAASYAGSVSRSYRGPFGLSDWYLPSKDELNALFVQRGAAGSFEPAFYSTSTEVDATTVWMQAFTNGAQSSLNKANFPYVRPIRAFS